MTPCPRCRIVRIPLDGRLVCYGCTREVASIVPGEEELGYQRWCADCDSWWELTGEFWRIARYERGDIATARGRQYVRDSSGAALVCLATHRAANRRAHERRRGRVA